MKNLHLHDQMLGWLRHWQRWYLVVDVAMLFQPNIDVETTSYAQG